MNFRIVPVTALIAAILPAVAIAEHPDDDITLDKIIVSAPAMSTLPDDTAHMQEHDMAQHRARTSDTASLLKGVAGVSLMGGGGVSSLPVIRGLGDDRLRIKVDGMDLISACANHMNSPLSYISPTRVGAIQVYSGISPVSLGGDSIGGTIIAASPDPLFAHSSDALLTAGHISTYYRSNGDARGADISASLATEQFSMRYSGSTSKANNYVAGDDFKPAGNAAVDRAPLDADEVGSSAYETYHHALDLGYRNANHLLQLKLAYQDIPYQGWPNQRMDMTLNRSDQINLQYRGDFDWGFLQGTLYSEQTHHKMQFGDDKQFLYGTAQGMPMETEGDNRGVSLLAEVYLSDRDTLRVGTDLQRYQLDDYWEASGGMVMTPNTFLNINNGQRDRDALFAEWEAVWSDRWTTLGGLRHETVHMNADDVQGYNPMMFGADAAAFNASDRDITDHNLDITAVARFTPSKGQRYDVGYAQKTRSPNLYERFAWSRHGMPMRMVNLVGDGNGYVGNVTLSPEIAHTFSVTADWHASDWGLTVTPYLTYVDDYISAERCSGAMGGMMGAVCTDANLAATQSFVYLQYQNVSARLYGLDISAEKQLLDSESMGTLNGRAVISYTRGKNRDTDDNLFNIMPLNATFTLTHAKGAWHNTLEWELVSAKDDVNAERNEMQTAGYGLLNLRSSYEWKQVRLELGVENLLDKFYSTPLGGAYLGQGATMNNSLPWGVTVPGMGRSIYTGLTFSF